MVYFSEYSSIQKVSLSVFSVTKITSVDDMTQIMIVGSQLLYSSVTACKTIYVNVNRIPMNGYSV